VDETDGSPEKFDTYRRNRVQLTAWQNGKLERFHGSIKGECLRPGTPISLEDALRIVGRYVEPYNQVRLHSAIGYVAPADKLTGREAEIVASRDRKLAEARQRRKEQRQAARLRAVA